MKLEAKVMQKPPAKPRAWPWMFAACLCGVFAWAAIAAPTGPGTLALLVRVLGSLSLVLACLASLAGLPVMQSVLGRGLGAAPRRWQLVSVILLCGVLGLWLMGTLAPVPQQIADARAGAAKTAGHTDPAVRDEQGSLVGRWILPLDPSVSQMITIQKDGNGYAVELRWKSGQHFSRPLRSEDRGRRFDVVGDTAQTHYVLMPNGDLKIRDKDGEFLTARRFRGNAANPAEVTAAMQSVWQDASCARDADCVGGPYRLIVLEICPTLIQHQARYTYRWTNGWGEEKFADGETWHGKDGQARGLVDYIGDKIELQNGFGAWQSYIYVCTFDVRRKEIVDLQMRPGRLFD